MENGEGEEEMKEGCCSYCEDPLPKGMKGSFCDEMCKDLQSRMLTSRKTKKKSGSMVIDIGPGGEKKPAEPEGAP